MTNNQSRLEVIYGMLESSLKETGDLGVAESQVKYKLLNLGLDDPTSLLIEARQELEERLGRVTPLNKYIIRGGNRIDWYTGPKDSGIWSSFKEYLLNPEGKGWDQKAVESIDKTSTDILGLLDPPALQGRFSTRGLVVGYVQSGKTANMTAVIAKAVDAGFRFVVVLAGMTDALREQTQKRLEGDLVERRVESWLPLTTSGSDIYTGTLQSLPNCSQRGETRLAVVKKNSQVLDRLLHLLRRTGEIKLGTCPAIVIDDESDQASINASSEADSITAINDKIRQILSCFPKVSYIGYTATPFANVLIDPVSCGVEEHRAEDLYPRDFIMALPCPPEYFGAERLFGRDLLEAEEVAPEQQGLDMIRIVPDDEIPLIRPNSRNVGNFKPQIVPTLEKAIRWFILATAARNDQDGHSTMLIHTTHYIKGHETLRGVIEKRMEEICDLLNKKDRDFIAELKGFWEKEYSKVDANLVGMEKRKWDDFAERLKPTSNAIEIVVENADSNNRLDYGDNPRRYIAIGGNVLARGLTMEGLIVSYFLRPSLQYDTLMQMGRWFGYRKGYEELPRLWTTQRMMTAFQDLATVEAEIREDINVYHRDYLTPLDFAVRIRHTPGMLITARNKMTAATACNLSYDGQHVQTFRFRHKDLDWLGNNWKAASKIIDRALGDKGMIEEVQGGRIIRNVNKNDVISFLSSYKIHDSHSKMMSDLLIEYIQDTNNSNMNKWTVGIIEPASGDMSSQELGGLKKVKLVNRAKLKTEAVDMADIKALMSRKDLLIDTPPDEPSKDLSWNDIKIIRKKLNLQPLLLLYAIDAESRPMRKSSDRENLDATSDILGIGIVFPGDHVGKPLSYVRVNLDRLVPIDEEDK